MKQSVTIKSWDCTIHSEHFVSRITLCLGRLYKAEGCLHKLDCNLHGLPLKQLKARAAFQVTEWINSGFVPAVDGLTLEITKNPNQGLVTAVPTHILCTSSHCTLKHHWAELFFHISQTIFLPMCNKQVPSPSNWKILHSESILAIYNPMRVSPTETIKHDRWFGCSLHERQDYNNCSRTWLYCAVSSWYGKCWAPS